MSGIHLNLKNNFDFAGSVSIFRQERTRCYLIYRFNVVFPLLPFDQYQVSDVNNKTGGLSNNKDRISFDDGVDQQ